MIFFFNFNIYQDQNKYCLLQVSGCLLCGLGWGWDLRIRVWTIVKALGTFALTKITDTMKNIFSKKPTPKGSCFYHHCSLNFAWLSNTPLFSLSLSLSLSCQFNFDAMQRPFERVNEKWQTPLEVNVFTFLSAHH